MTRTAFTSHLIQLVIIAIIGFAWYWSTSSGSVNNLLLPRPTAVWLSFTRLVATGQFWSAVRVTLFTIAQAYAIALIAGIGAGYLVSRSRFLIDVFEPVIAALFAIPITLFFPMFILFFGIGVGSKIAYGATYAFFPVALHAIAGFANVRPHFLRAAQSMGVSRWRTFWHVLIPSALPVVLNGARIGFFICFASVLGGETLSSVSGVGRNIAQAAELMDVARMYAWIAFVVLAAISLTLLAGGLEKRASTEGERV